MSLLGNIFLCINLLTVFLPQPGYIHPDEFFQSTEIVAGDILKVNHFRAWEFEDSMPVRSIVFPYIVTGPSILALKLMNSTDYFNFEISPFKLIILTRLPIALISITGYKATDKLASVFGVNTYLSKILWSTSYVTWTYFTRTFSNSVEAVLFAVILLLILCSPETKHTLETVKSCKSLEVEEESSDLDTDCSEDENVKEKQEDTERCIRNEKYKQTMGRGLFLGILIIAGFFNRPTFLVFVFVPLIFWLFNVKTMYNWKSYFRLYDLILSLSIGACISFLVFVMVDTLYFSPNICNDLLESFDLIIDQKVSTISFLLLIKKISSKVVVTPWNFILYNVNTENLAEHGLHPRYTHLLVNLPLLTGPLFFPILFMSVVTFIGIHKTVKSNHHQYPNMIWVTLMMLVPVITLSIFPHQEPRFLIPLLPVLIVLGARVVKAMSPAIFSFYVLWGLFNFLLVLTYGFLHQSALIPSMSIYQETISRSHPATIKHAIFYKTYPPPRHLLLVKPDVNLKVHDLAGAPKHSFINLIKDTKKGCTRSRAKCQLNVFMPSTITPRILNDLAQYDVETTSVCPHLSMESPPRFRAWWDRRIDLKEFLSEFCLDILRIS